MSTTCNNKQANSPSANTSTNQIKPNQTRQPNQIRQPKPNQMANQTNLLSKMQDGRAFTDYRPRCTVQFQMKNENAKNSFDTRQFLTNNAEKMMKANMEIAEKNTPCASTNLNKVGTMLPEKNMMKCDANTCNFSQNVNPTGVGTGRIYK